MNGGKVASTEKATFGAGCFWQPEAELKDVPGVVGTQVGYEGLLARFWEMHDPTQVDRQGPDVGNQYRSVIFFHTPEQEAAAKASKERVQERFRKPIATWIEPATGFWRAEEYHQCYLEKRGQQGGLAGMMRSVLGS